MYLESKEWSMKNRNINLIEHDDIQYDNELDKFIWKPGFAEEISDYLNHQNHDHDLDEKIFIYQFLNQRNY